MTPWGVAFFKNSSKSHLESSEIADRRLHFFNTSWSSFQTSPTLRCSGLEDVPDCLGQPTNDPSNHWEWWHDQRLQRVIGWLPNLVPFFSAWENHGVLRYQLKVEHQTLTSWWFPMLSKVSFLNGKTQGSEKRVSEALWKSRCLLTFPPQKKTMTPTINWHILGCSYPLPLGQSFKGNIRIPRDRISGAQPGPWLIWVQSSAPSFVQEFWLRTLGDFCGFPTKGRMIFSLWNGCLKTWWKCRVYVGDVGEMMRCEMTWREDLDVIWSEMLISCDMIQVSGKVSVRNSVSGKRQTAVGNI